MTAARHFLPATHCGLLVDTGDDFPDAFRKELKELGEEMIWFRPREGKTTRALNIYSGTKIGYASPYEIALKHEGKDINPFNTCPRKSTSPLKTSFCHLHLSPLPSFRNGYTSSAFASEQKSLFRRWNGSGEKV